MSNAQDIPNAIRSSNLHYRGFGHYADEDFLPETPPPLHYMKEPPHILPRKKKFHLLQEEVITNMKPLPGAPNNFNLSQPADCAKNGLGQRQESNLESTLSVEEWVKGVSLQTSKHNFLEMPISHILEGDTTTGNHGASVSGCISLPQSPATSPGQHRRGLPRVFSTSRLPDVALVHSMRLKLDAAVNGDPDAPSTGESELSLGNKSELVSRTQSVGLVKSSSSASLVTQVAHFAPKVDGHVDDSYAASLSKQGPSLSHGFGSWLFKKPSDTVQNRDVNMFSPTSF